MGMLRRHQDEDDQHERLRFQMREKLLSIGDDYWIEDSEGNRVFKVNGKALRLRDTWVLESRDGHEVAKLQERKLTVRDKVSIDLVGERATVKKALIGFRERYDVELDHGHDLKVRGNVVDHEYQVERDGHEIAAVSKKWFRFRDTYGIEVEDPVDAPLVLAVAVAVDAMAHDRG